MGLFDRIFKKKPTQTQASQASRPAPSITSNGRTSGSHQPRQEDTPEFKAFAKLLELSFGSAENPIKVDKERLKDESTYTGEAVTLEDGSILPYGWGKKTYVHDGREVILTGQFKDGDINGVCYMNMHFAMVTGRFINSRPYGWIVSLEHGLLFGAFENGDVTHALSAQVLWIRDEYRDYKGLPIGTYPKRGTIIFGQPYKVKDGVVLQKAIGMQFTNDGDVYVGTDEKGLSKTGYFVKYRSDGYIEIGYYINGELVTPMSFQELLTHYPLANNAKNRAIVIDTNKKYF